MRATTEKVGFCSPFPVSDEEPSDEEEENALGTDAKARRLEVPNETSDVVFGYNPVESLLFRSIVEKWKPLYAKSPHRRKRAIASEVVDEMTDCGCAVFVRAKGGIIVRETDYDSIVSRIFKVLRKPITKSTKEPRVSGKKRPQVSEEVAATSRPSRRSKPRYVAPKLIEQQSFGNVSIGDRSSVDELFEMFTTGNGAMPGPTKLDVTESGWLSILSGDEKDDATMSASVAKEDGVFPASGPHKVRESLRESGTSCLSVAKTQAKSRRPAETQERETDPPHFALPCILPFPVPLSAPKKPSNSLIPLRIPHNKKKKPKAKPWLPGIGVEAAAAVTEKPQPRRKVSARVLSVPKNTSPTLLAPKPSLALFLEGLQQLNTTARARQQHHAKTWDSLMRLEKSIEDCYDPSKKQNSAAMSGEVGGAVAFAEV